MKKNLVRVFLGAFALVVCLFVGSHSSANEINKQNSQKVAALNAQITALSGELSKPSSRGDAARSEVARLAAERFQFLAYAAENDPAGVFGLALPDSVLAKIPSGLRNFFEKRDEIEGELEVIEECDKTHHKTLYNVKQNGKSIALKFSEEPKQDLRTGSKVRVKGIQVGDTLDLGGSTTATNFEVTSAALANTIGDHKVAVILVNFQDLQTQPYTVAQAQDAAFNTTSNYYRENSYGQTSLSGDVFGWFTIPVSSTSCDTSAIATYAQQAATNAGANLSAYNHYVYAFPQTSACTFSGRASVGGAPGEAWINGWFELGVVGHELGHNFGLYHSRSMDCGTAVIGDSCTTSEYGDSFDLMGGSNSAHFNSFQKERLGWLNYGGSPPLQTITTSGTYWVDAYETTGSNPKGLKILKSTDPTTGMRTWYYLEHRTASGFDSYLANWGSQVNGTIVRTGSEANPQDTYLLDTTPATTSWMDSVLAPGQSFNDTAAGVTFTTVSADSTGAWVQISMNSQPCTHSNPSVAVSPGQSQWLKSGTTFTYTVTITNNESGGCSTGNFNLQGNVPAGWSASYSAPSLSVVPGGSASALLYVTSPTGTPDGTYNVNAIAVNGSYSGSSSAVYSIVSALGVNASSGSSKYTRTQKASVTASVSAGGSPLAGAGVTFTMTKPNGSVVTQTAITGSNGSAVFVYSFNKRSDPLGTYQVKAVSSANSLTGQGATSFLVNK